MSIWVKILLGLAAITIVFLSLKSRRTLAGDILNNAEAILAWVSSWATSSDFPSYCQLETSIGLDLDDPRMKEMQASDPGGAKPYILITRECSMMTLFELTGAMDIVGDEEFKSITKQLRETMSSYFQRPGHTIEFSFEKDPEAIHAAVANMMAPAYQTAERIGLDLKDVLDDRVSRVAALCSHESAYVVLYTHLSSMSSEEVKREMEDHRERIKRHNLEPMPYAQSPSAVIKGLLHTHETVVSAMLEDFKLAKLHVSLMSTHEACNHIKRAYDRDNTDFKWKPTLPGDRFWPRQAPRKRDKSDLFLPRLQEQMNSTKARVYGDYVKIGSMYHGSVFMELGPQDVKPFSELFRRLGRDIPWRIKFTIEPGGIDSNRLKQLIVSVTGFMSSINGSIKRAFDAIEAAQEDGENHVSLKICAATWANSEKDCQRRVSALVKAMQGWGTCQVTDDSGDPVSGLASTIPGYSDRNISPKMVPPLTDLVKMLPFQRPASPWSSGGSIPLRSLDGKLYPYQPNSSLQTAWIDLIWAIMGSGKSVWLNTLNLGAILSPGLRRLPLITIIDVGPSSSGLVSLIQHALPPERRHEAIYVRLRNTKEFAINPFDTELGCREPTAFGREASIAMLCMLATPVGETAPPPKTPELASMMIDEVYRKYGTPGQEKIYERTYDDMVDQAVDELGIEVTERTSWWNITDKLAMAGRMREARSAQRFAVPVLSDLIEIVRSERIRSTFSPSENSRVMAGTGMTLIDDMVLVITTALRDFEVIAGHTQFEINEASRIVALDLDIVTRGAGEEGKRKASIMFSFARQIAARQYYLDEEVVELAPPIYAAFHKTRIEDIKDEMKAICVDELHRTGGMRAFRKLLSLDRREGRKWGIRVSLSSQLLEDFDDEGESITETAFSIYMMNAGTQSQRDEAQRIFGLSASAMQALERDVRGHGKFLVWHQIKTGVVTQVLHNAPGAIELWAFSTTAKDAGLRRRLYEKLSPPLARKILAKEFPTGSAVTYMEALQKEQKSDDDESVIDTVVKELILKYSNEAKEEALSV